MLNAIQIFHNDEFGDIRTVIVDGVPWFFSKDVTAVLGYSNPRDAVSRHVDAEDKGVVKHDTLSGAQNMSIINESGVYSLILSSKLPSAKSFKHWATSEILPAIRKTGVYMLQDSSYFINKYFPSASPQQRLLLQSALEEIETLTQQ